MANWIMLIVTLLGLVVNGISVYRTSHWISSFFLGVCSMGVLYWFEQIMREESQRRQDEPWERPPDDPRVCNDINCMFNGEHARH